MRTDADLERDMMEERKWDPNLDATAITVAVKGGRRGHSWASSGPMSARQKLKQRRNTLLAWLPSRAILSARSWPEWEAAERAA